MSFMMKTENGYVPISGNNGSSASEISYDNTESKLKATNVQEVIDEVNKDVTTLQTAKADKSYIDAELEKKADKNEIYTKSQTDTAITNKVAEIVAGAPEDFDTLKEMSDWISTHEESAAAMNTAIQGKITTPQIATVGQLLSVKAIDNDGKPTEWECIDKGNGGGTADQITYSNTDSKLKAVNVQSAIDEVNKNVTTLQTEIPNKANKTDLIGVNILPYPYYDKGGLSYALPWTAEDGTVGAVGSSDYFESSFNFIWNRFSGRKLDIDKKKYIFHARLSRKTQETSMYIMMVLRKSDGTYSNEMKSNFNDGYAQIILDNTAGEWEAINRLCIMVPKNITVDEPNIKIQLEEGDTPHDYRPYTINNQLEELRKNNGGGSSEEGRIIKTYDLVAGTQIPLEKDVYYPCHFFYDTDSSRMYFGEYACLVSSGLRIDYLYVSSFGTVKINSSSDIYSGVYDDVKGIFTLTGSDPGRKIMI